MEANPLSAFAPLQMLVIEDDPMTAEIVCGHFAELGFAVAHAADGVSALQLMEQRLPDIVLCDRLMPKMSGADVLEAVRARGPAWQRMAFVFLTALSDRRDRYAMMPLHPDGYLCKPVDFDEADLELAAILSGWRQRLAEAVPANGD